MAHGLFCKCKKCDPIGHLFKTPKSPFANPMNTGSKVRDSQRYGPNQNYYGGRGRPDGPGHGHYNPNGGFNRPPVSDFLGNKAITKYDPNGKKPPRDYPRW